MYLCEGTTLEYGHDNMLYSPPEKVSTTKNKYLPTPELFRKEDPAAIQDANKRGDLRVKG